LKNHVEKESVSMYHPQKNSGNGKPLPIMPVEKEKL